MEINYLIPIVGVAGGLAATLYASWRYYHRYYQAVPPNRALVLYGGRSSHPATSGDPSIEVRAPRILVGGGAFIPPWRHGSDNLSLSPIDCEARVIVGDSGGDAVAPPWEVRLTLQVKIPTEPRMLATAAENLLGRSEAEIQALVVRTVESIAPAVVLRELTNGFGIQWDRMAAEIQAAVAPELVAVGLEVRTLSVTLMQRVSPLERGETGNPGTPQISLNIPRASGDLGVRLRGTEARLDRTERSLGLLGAEVMRLGRDGSKFPELPALQPYDSTVDENSSGPSPRSSRGTARRGTDGSSRPLLDAEE
jgi:hypothetical protein